MLSSSFARQPRRAGSRVFRVAIAVVLAVVIVSATSGVVNAQSGSWSQVRTARFTVLSPDGADAQNVAVALDAFREAFGRLVPGANINPMAPTKVFAFDRFETYEPYAPRYGGHPVRVAGAFVGGAQANFLALTLDEGPRAWSVAYHELTHLIVNQTMEHPPAWFNEGIAEFYSTFALDAEGRAAELGHLIPEHLVLLRRDRWLPLDDLFDVTTSSPLYNEGDKRSMFYAESWALVHYLFSRPDRTTQLFDFLDRLAAGQGTPSAFRAAFAMSPATLAEELRRYVDQSEWPVQVHPLGKRVEASLNGGRVESIGRGDTLAALAGLQLSFNRQDEAMGLAQLAVDADEESAAAWTVLAAAHVERQMDVEAVPFLIKAAALPLDDPYACYLLGTSAIRMVERVNESNLPRLQGLRIATASLERAVASVPTYAEAWASLSHAALADGSRSRDALNASRRALSLMPSRRHYVLLEAQALMQEGDLDAARRLMEDLLQHDTATPLADKAVEVLSRISVLEEARARRLQAR